MHLQQRVRDDTLDILELVRRHLLKRPDTTKIEGFLGRRCHRATKHAVDKLFEIDLAVRCESVEERDQVVRRQVSVQFAEHGDEVIEADVAHAGDVKALELGLELVRGQGDADVHVMERHLQIGLGPQGAAHVAGHPLPLGEVVTLWQVPRTAWALRTGHLGQTPAEVELLSLQVVVVFRVLVQQTVDGAERGVENAPLSLLAWLGELVPDRDVLVARRDLCVFAVHTEALLEILAPVAVTVVAAEADLAAQLLVHTPEDGLGHGAARGHDVQGVDEEKEGAVDLAFLAWGGALAGQQGFEHLHAALLDLVQCAVSAWHDHAFVLVQELLELLGPGHDGADAGGRNLGGLLPMAAVLIAPELDLDEVLQHQTEQSEVVS
mmetsp:Transcript_39586/g.113498  ORF Transcript_39586/g.113498 Transcript_39586/m.113498 type:complete len:379 (+) Transcript_39586:505-1641(+)